MKTIGIIIGTIGAALFVWHSVKVVMGTDYGGSGLSNHQLMSLVGGILVVAGTGVYILGRRRKGG